MGTSTCRRRRAPVVEDAPSRPDPTTALGVWFEVGLAMAGDRIWQWVGGMASQAKRTNTGHRGWDTRTPSGGHESALRVDVSSCS